MFKLKAYGHYLIFSALAAILAALLFLPGLPGDFVFDDHPNIVTDKSIQLTRLDADSLYNLATSPQISGFMRILPTLSFAVDYWRAGGADPATFKITNIVIHALTTLVLAWFFRSLLLIAGVRREYVFWTAPALALAWAAHPIQVSAVLYAVQRIQTMGSLFLVLALWAYLQARQAQLEGRSGRAYWLLTLLLWILALGCKEDSALLPAYALALELTVLRFAAADAQIAKLLRYGYFVAAMAGALVYFLSTVPGHWSWEAYTGRDFSTPERLLTQGRVLCMYLWQTIMPLPHHMPFYYDWVQPSRGLLRPWTTLPAIVFLLALLGLAWSLRTRLPLFALGVLLFFAAHFITSNVVALELAFEHRNHFALIGAVLACGSALAHVAWRTKLPVTVQVASCAVILAALGSATLWRAHSWHSALSLAQSNSENAPTSARAWIALCAEYVESGGGITEDNLLLDKAIEACAAGTAAVPESLNNLALLIVLKTISGDVTQQDWDLLEQRLRTAPMTWDNRRAPRILSHHQRQGVALDKKRLVGILDILLQREPHRPFDTASLGYFVMNDLAEPDLAIPYFVKAIEASPPDDPFPQQLGGELRHKGRPDLAEQIELLGLTRRRAAGGGQDEAK